jgi:hypothetical protein
MMLVWHSHVAVYTDFQTKACQDNKLMQVTSCNAETALDIADSLFAYGNLQGNMNVHG